MQRNLPGPLIKYRSNHGLAEAQRVSAECQHHIVATGADPHIWIKAMKTAKERLYVFTPDEPGEFNRVTKLLS